MQFVRASVLFPAAMIFSHLAGASPPVPLKPGRYEVNSVMTIRGQSGTPDSKTRCIKAEHLANVEDIFNQRYIAGFKADPSCTVSNLSLGGGKVSYKADCKLSTVTVEGTLTDSSFSVVRAATPKAANGLAVSSKIDGKREGDCK